jgi:hypothetical protein
MLADWLFFLFTDYYEIEAYDCDLFSMGFIPEFPVLLDHISQLNSSC